MRTRTNGVVKKHQVEGEDSDNDLDIFYLHILFRSIGQILEGSVGACILVDSNNLSVDDE